MVYYNPNDGLYYQGYEYIGGEEFWWSLANGMIEGTYYVNGVAKPGLDESGTGVSGGLRYSNGALLTGEFEGVQYIQGQLAATFTGVHNGLRYDNGALFNGVYAEWDAGIGDVIATGYYINGQATDAWGWFMHSTGGTGEFEGLRYSEGALLTGEFQGTYYINGQATELDSSGNGTWNGQTYVNGVVQNGGGGGGGNGGGNNSGSQSVKVVGKSKFVGKIKFA